MLHLPVGSGQDQHHCTALHSLLPHGMHRNGAQNLITLPSVQVRHQKGRISSTTAGISCSTGYLSQRGRFSPHPNQHSSYSPFLWFFCTSTTSTTSRGKGRRRWRRWRRTPTRPSRRLWPSTKTRWIGHVLQSQNRQRTQGWTDLSQAKKTGI